MNLEPQKSKFGSRKSGIVNRNSRTKQEVAGDPRPMCSRPWAGILFGASIIMSVGLLCLLGGTYGYFNGPFPTRQAMIGGFFVFIGNSLSILLTIAACIFVFRGKSHKVIFLIMVVCLFIITCMAGYVAFNFLTLKLTADDVDTYITNSKDVPSFIDTMQKELKCCGGTDFRTYANKTTKKDGSFIVPKSCCWRPQEGSCDTEIQMVEPNHSVILYEPHGPIGYKSIDYREALEIWNDALKIMMDIEMKKPEVVPQNMKPYHELNHEKVVAVMVSSKPGHKYEEKYGNKSYYLTDEENLKIKTFGCGTYLEGFSTYNLGHPRHRALINSVLISLKVITILVLLVEITKCIVVLYYGLKFRMEQSGVGVGGDSVINPPPPKRSNQSSVGGQRGPEPDHSAKKHRVKRKRKGVDRPGANRDKDGVDTPWGYDL